MNKLSIAMNVGEQIKDSRNVYWFVRVSIDLSKYASQIIFAVLLLREFQWLVNTTIIHLSNV